MIRPLINHPEDIKVSYLCSCKLQDGLQWSNAHISRDLHKILTRRDIIRKDHTNKDLTLLVQEAVTFKSPEEHHPSLLPQLDLQVADHSQVDDLRTETYTEAKVPCAQGVKTLVAEAQAVHFRLGKAVSVNNSHRMSSSSMAVRARRQSLRPQPHRVK